MMPVPMKSDPVNSVPIKAIEVRWFAAYREAAGVAQEKVHTAAATAAELFAEMQGKHPALAPFSAALLAINNEMADWTRKLQDGDEVLFFPPVAGG
jgi:molybdopterin converting factor subunit 1